MSIYEAAVTTTYSDAEQDTFSFHYYPTPSDHYSIWPLVGMALAFAGVLTWHGIKRALLVAAVTVGLSGCSEAIQEIRAIHAEQIIRGGE